MYCGHAAIALVIKTRWPSTPMVPLTLACYGPDFIDLAFMIPHPRAGTGVYSHSVPSVLLCASIAAILFAALEKGPGALAIFAGWLTHWPADALTGLKPILGVSTTIGLDLYHFSVMDALLETSVIGVACWYVARSMGSSARQRRIVLIMGTLLTVAQLAFDFAMSRIDGMPWRPTWLANVHRAPQGPELRTPTFPLIDTSRAD